MAAPPSRALGALTGLLSAAAGVAASEATAALLTGVSSPVVAVGNRAVDLTPRPVKEWAVDTFGAADKPLLLAGIAVVVALVAAAAGAVGVRRPRLAAGVFLLLSVVAGSVAVTDRAADAGVGPRLLPVAALAAVAVGALLVLLRSLRPAARTRSDRRTFLLAAAAVAGVAAAGTLLARRYGELAAAASRAGVRLPRPGSPAPPVPAGTALDVVGISPYLTPNDDFYRVDTALRVPDVPVEGWRLRLRGMVERELELSYADLLDRGLVERRITLTCVSNPVGGELAGNATWLGVPMHVLLEEAGVRPGADAVRSLSADGFTAGTPLSVLADPDRGALVAVGMNGEPLPLEHGFPARMVTPGLYGYVSATKWLVELEVSRFADFDAYWTTRGYAEEAPIKVASRIDVPGSFAGLRPGRTPVAGVAWSQGRGIDRVEVRVDEGPWEAAELAAEDGVDTWRQWVWWWDAAPGNHTLEVRATDRTGTTQTSRRAPIAPDGATGWHSVTLTVG
ncbi:molybdopterin-dependent oxidoreductase [Nocardioides caldifontis]|uniref:molybdopterin-dependent oxidoreductase n=1 Tax=Nocardioides caldifontis TaxID=2588938 RepID=UPI0011DFA959|nr:molybdopterin-dependent oxidoreductase [Nocardioides caldifontis]